MFASGRESIKRNTDFQEHADLAALHGKLRPKRTPSRAEHHSISNFHKVMRQTAALTPLCNDFTPIGGTETGLQKHIGIVPNTAHILLPSTGCSPPGVVPSDGPDQSPYQRTASSIDRGLPTDPYLKDYLCYRYTQLDLLPYSNNLVQRKTLLLHAQSPFIHREQKVFRTTRERPQT
jgi:hypothetical protein